MGVDTKAYISKNVDLVQLVDHLKLKYVDVKLHTGTVYSDSSCFTITFKDGNDNRQMFVVISNVDRNDEINGIYLNLGMWGNSVDIMKYILDTFGGYIDENDCDDVGYTPYNIEKFIEHTMSKREIFKVKVISTFGIEKMNSFMVLAEEYKKLED